MKTLLKYSTMFLLTATAFILSSCKEELSYTPLSTEPPVIESITPLNAPKNSDITIKGDFLNTVYKAFIGEQEVEIKSKVTDKHIILMATGTVDGKIRLMATVGNTVVETTSKESFTYQYVAPTINETQLPAKVEVGTMVLLMGQNMQSAEDIFIVNGDAAHSSSDPVKVKIESKNDKEITFMMPYVEFTKIAFYATYYNGSEIVADEPLEKSCDVVVNHPDVTGVSATALTENQAFTISGTNLDKITTVMIGEHKAVISDVKATSVNVTVPPGFDDGMHSDVVVSIKYFDDAAIKNLTQNFSVFVPAIMLGKDQTLTARGKNMPTYAGVPGAWAPPYWYHNFLTLESGLSMHNADFKTTVDPVSLNFLDMVYGASSFKGNVSITAANTINKSRITEPMYNSVRPYIYLSTSSTGTLSLTNPSANTGNLRNISPTGSGPSIFGIANGKGSEGNTPAASGSVVVMFLPVWPQTKDIQDNGSAAQKQAIADVTAAVRAGSLTKIDANNFPVDLSSNSVGGIPLVYTGGEKAGQSVVLSSISHDSFSKDALNLGAYPNLVVDGKDGVVMVIYYDYANGYTPATPAKGIVKIGFLHIKKLILDKSGSTNEEPLSSIIVLDSYFQKYAYNPVQ